MSELPDREFCRREHLTLGTFRWWKSQLRDAITACPKSGSAIASPAFLAVTVRDSTAAAAEPGAVEILLQGDERRARIRADCPVELAVAVTTVLRGTSSCS